MITNSSPQISAVISTRNRAESIGMAVESILLNTHKNFEVIVVDQSTGTETKEELQRFSHDPRFIYMHSNTVGTGKSRNIGLGLAKSPIVAYTDDDCKVSPPWLEKLEQVFIANPKIALVYCRVDPGPYDKTKGYIPAFEIKKDQLRKKLSDCFWDELGIGAGMAIRKESLDQINGFDDNLGPGSIFRSGEDRDIAFRLLLKGWWVFDASQISVIHYGFRTFALGKEHTDRDFFSLGAIYIKPIICGYWKAILLLFSIPLLKNFLEPIIQVFQLKKPSGARKLYSFLRGGIAGFFTPVDKKMILFQVVEHKGD